MKKLLLITALVALPGCNWLFGTNTPKCTTPGAKRCNKNNVEVCAGDKHWEKAINCTEYKMTCSEEKKTCLKGD